MNFQALLLATDTIDPYQSGRYVGLALMMLFMAAGAFKCVSIMRRPTTSGLCVLALLLWIAALMAGTVWSFAIESYWLPESARWAITLINVPLFIAVLVVAIVGLALYDSNRFNQGRKQAVWALVLGCIGILGTAATHLATPLRALAEKVAAEAGAGAAGLPTVNEQWNFSLTPPDKTWRRMSANEWSPLSCASYLQRDKDIYLVVIAEHGAGLKAENAVNTVAAAVKSNLATKGIFREQQEERVELAGLEFVHLTSMGWNSEVKSDLVYEHWISAHAGFAWQIMVWGKADKRMEIEKSSKAMVGGFRVLDRSRKADIRDEAVEVDRLKQGYKVRLADLGWQAWRRDEKSEHPLPVLADFGAQMIGSAMVIMPYHHQIEGPPPTAEALARGFLAEYGFTYERDSADFTTRRIDKPFPGLEITAEREVGDGELYRCLFRVCQSGHHGWLVGGWTLKTPSSTLDAVREALDRVQLMVPEAAQSAAGPATATPRTRAQADALASLLNHIGIWYHSRNENEDALRYFGEATKLSPEDRVIFENVTFALESAKKHDEALAFMDSGRDRTFAKEHAHLMRRVNLMLGAGQAEAGAKQMQELIKEGYKHHDNVLEVINSLLDSEHEGQAQEVADAYVLAFPEQRPRLWQAQVAGRSNEPEKAYALLESLIKDEPEYLDARYILGDLFNRTGEFERALAVADGLAEKKQDTARLHMMRGRAHMGRKWYRDAKSSIEKAAALAPEDDEVKTALKEASAWLGQGSNSEIKTPIEPVPLPQRIASSLEELRSLPEEFGEGHNAAMLLWARCIHYTKDKPMRTTTRRVIRVLNDQAAGDYSSMEFTYDPLIERLHVNRAEVVDGDGKVVARAGIDDAYILDADDRSMATTERTVHIQVPGLKAGHTLDCEVTIERLFPRKTIPLMRHLFAAGIPTRLEVVSVSGEVGAVAEDVLMPEKIKITREPDSVVYEVEDAPMSSNESYQEPIEKWAPVVVLSTKDKTWAEVGRDYLKEIADRLKPDPALEKEAKELTQGLQGVREKARVLAAFVQKSIRYKAVEFGVRGQMPNAPSLTLQQRYGDCKDQALLLHHLLRACDIASNLALVNTNWDLDLKQPTMDAFNHVIVHVPALKDTLFIDTTASYLAAADNSPYGLWGLPALVLTSEGPVILKIPEPVAGSCEVTSKRHLSLVGTDSVRVEEELTLQGYYASGMRDGFARREPKERFQHAQDLLDDMGSYRLEEFEFENLTELAKPVVLRLTYAMPNAIEQRGEVTKLRLPNAWETDYLRISFIKDRQTPFRWNMPFSMHSEVSWDESLNIAPDSLASMVREGRSRFGHWKMAVDDGLRFKFSVTPGSHAAAEYTEFQSLWSGAHDLWTKELVLKAQ